VASYASVFGADQKTLKAPSVLAKAVGADHEIEKWAGNTPGILVDCRIAGRDALSFYDKDCTMLPNHSFFELPACPQGLPAPCLDESSLHSMSLSSGSGFRLE